jgi:hypothetical protein
MSDELLCQLEWRICYDRLAACRQRLVQEISMREMRGISVVDQITGEDTMAGIAQNIDDRAATSSRLPNAVG